MRTPKSRGQRCSLPRSLFKLDGKVYTITELSTMTGLTAEAIRAIHRRCTMSGRNTLTWDDLRTSSCASR